jgi:proline dehydrogenase
MLRRALLWASTNPFLAGRLPRYGFVKRATRRFMPGEDLSDALHAAEGLAERGIASSLTLLGEHLRADAQADEVRDHYLAVLERVAERGLDAHISVKPTQVGLGFSADGAHDRLLSLMRATETRVWIDMESSEHVDATLDIFRSLRKEGDNVGVCLQAYLRRSAADLDELLPLDPSIRVVKGAYRESPEVAFARKPEVDRNFVRMTSQVLRAKAAGGRATAVIATHDPRMIAEAGRLAHELGLGKDAYEYAMLYGIAQAEQRRLALNGHRVRVLVSYGSAWFAWYMRRLAERPANLWFVAKQLVR